MGGAIVPAGKMQTDFAGGVSDGVCGASGLDYNRDGVTGRKSWFFFDGEIVCLGAGLSGDGKTPLITSIEQSLLQTDIVAGVGAGAGIVQPKTPHVLTGTRWVWQDQQGYVFPTATEVSLGGSAQSGAWNKVYLSGADATISKNVFSLWIEHGARPAAAYSYIILPGVEAGQTAAYAAHPPIEILRNTPPLQAVRDPRSKRTLAIFFAAGELQTPAGKLAVDRPCAVSLRETDSNPAVMIADPTQLSAHIQLTFGNKTMSVDLPQGEAAGKSIAVTLP